MIKSCTLSLALLFGLNVGSGFSQQSKQFNLDTYNNFLNSTKNMTPDELAALHPAGTFKSGAQTDIYSAAYFDSVSIKLGLTEDEKTLITKNGFVVTERLNYPSFGGALADIYHKDLPVFVSTDAILHSIHMSYDRILKAVENQFLIGQLDSLLAGLQNHLPVLAQKYSGYPGMAQMLNDVDVYLTVPRILLDGSASPYFSTNKSTVDTILSLVKAEQMVEYPIFSSHERKIDFSQFTTRGHYTSTPELSNYFKAMIWLGRIELYLIAPQSLDNKQTDADIQRQTIDAVLVKELAETGNAFPRLASIDSTLRFFVGESDNVTLPNVDSVANAIDLKTADELLDTLRWKEFRDTLATKTYASQRILSQVLISDPMTPDQIKPAASFLLLGQRFVIDSYVTGNVVFDRILYQDQKIWRALPSTLDVLFALGNDAAAQLLKSELDEYKYSSNLAALRYLVDSYDEDFWKLSLYNAWLNSIRGLNPPAERSALPAFMQTAAWWQEKMNTQLSAWAELRHDNLLYAKQSYTGGMICSYPEGYVEPIPEFYDAVKSYAAAAIGRFEQPPLSGTGASYYFTRVMNVSDTLGSIARKELAGTQLSSAEKAFLQNVLYDGHMCGQIYNGWYPSLFYGVNPVADSDMVVADVHTCPTDEFGAMVGWVLHAGTGPVNTAVLVTQLPDGRLTAFAGPVLSYYEHVSMNFKRLTDEEWKSAYNLSPSLRPSFVNIYLTTTDGSARPEGLSLLTSVDDQQPPEPQPRTILLSQNYPNPFNSTTMISFSIPHALSHSRADVIVYSITGQIVKRIFSRDLPAGNYTVSWDGKDDHGTAVASGVYFYRLTVGGARASGKLVLIK